jgi:hypothetical protein
MANATISYPNVLSGGAHLGASARLLTPRITAPAGTMTSFTVPIPDVTPNTQVIGCTAVGGNAGSVQPTSIEPTAGTITVNFDSQTLDGTEVFDLILLTR